MRLGGPIDHTWQTPDHWIAAVRSWGYRAAYCPIDERADSTTIAAYARAAAAADIVIAEVGVWNNPIAADAGERAAAISKAQARLALADEIGAACAVNITGSRGPVWDGPDARNYDADTFAMIVDSVRAIVDAVKPTRTVYTLETMPWMLPDSIESYRALLTAIDRPTVGVHFDPINLLNGVNRFYDHRAYIDAFVTEFGAEIRSVHIKDMTIDRPFVVALRECAPGKGVIDYRALL
ncbi:MAG: hypothetical protein RLZZ297_1199, partial [Chloroflexota bacterium]